MAGARRKARGTVEDEERALADVAGDPRGAHAPDRLRAALASRHARVVAHAAWLVKQHVLEGLEDELVAAFERFLGDPLKTDPSCRAKLAVLEALDFGESLREGPFLRAVRHVQREPAWGPPVDTAAGLRARGLLALARLGYSELDLVAAEALGDPEPPVRIAALEALAHGGVRAGAALALFKVRAGDDDPLVTLAAMGTLLELAPEHALGVLEALVSGEDGGLRELACVALGQSKSAAAADVLLGALERCVISAERVPVLRGLGLHRSDRALAALLAIIADRSATDAKEAIRALAARRYEPGIADRVRAAARANDADLAGELVAAFSISEVP